MRAFRIRYEKKKSKIVEDDELMSEYAPSELSDYLAQEDLGSDDDYEEDEWDGDGEGIQDEVVVTQMTEAQLLEEAMDQQNIVLETVYPGDNLNFPMTGDICRIAFTCTLVSTGKVVSSSKNAMGFQYVDFVLGINQLCKGVDRALYRMSVGGRYRVFLTAQYSYGDDGFPPHIPPHSEVMFELTLASFRPRVIWSKPLVQDLGFSEKPYFEEVERVDDDDDDF